MKKNKNEFILSIVIILFALLGLYLYKQSNSVVTTAEIPYDEKGNVEYKVYLNDKKYYNKEFLDEGMQYISSIIDYVDIDFNYSARYKGISKYDISKSITADIKIVDSDDNNKVIYSKKDVLKGTNETKDSLNISDNVRIDYSKYNSLTNEFKTNYGIRAKCLLTITYNLTYISKDDGLSQNRVMNVEIPLSEQMINISKSDSISTSSIYIAKSTKSAFNNIMFILSIIFEAIAFVIIIILIVEVRNRINRESKYDRFIKKTLKEYDSYITEATTDNSYDKKIIKVGSFKELLDVRNNVEKAIIYIKIDDNTSKFQIIDEEIYEYKVTRKEMDE